MSTLTLRLSDPNANLQSVGGKGLSLAKLSRAGLPVPDGFHITTEAYRRFVAANDLQARILEALKVVDASLPASLDSASANIGRLFAGGRMPDDVASAISAAYVDLCGGESGIDPGTAVAVRSSATAEDLPEASFAGQQETFLNIRGVEAVLEAVRQCWASLWTARAIAYRAKVGTASESVELAVVVQELVCADASGVMFTVNPIHVNRNEMIIAATWGLGESIVSGSVTPDTLTVSKSTGRVIRRETAEKRVMTVRTESGTREVPVPRSRKKKPVLNDAQAAALARIGADIERMYEMPMDIEWTLAGGKYAIVQARPITALPPEGEEAQLEWPVPHPKAVMARGSFAEFVPEPVTPLFATLAVPIARDATVRLMGDFGMGGRDSYLFSVINDYVYVGFIFTPKMMWKMIVVTTSMTKSVVKTAAAKMQAARERYLAAVGRWARRELPELRPSQLLDGAVELFGETAEYYTMAQSATIPAATLTEMTFSKFYDVLVKRKGDPEASKFVFGSDNEALRAEQSLYDLALWAKELPELETYLRRAPAHEIWAALSSEKEPAAGLREFGSHLRDYMQQHGHAIYDLDFSKPVPADDPVPLLETIKVYMSGASSPYERQRSALEFREQAVAAVTRRLDPIRKKYFVQLLKVAQDTAPLRENSIADIGLGYPQLRRMLGELGRRLQTGGAIGCASDVYWLELAEAQRLAADLEKGEPLKSFVSEIEARKAKWQAMRRISPPTALPRSSWMARFFPGDKQTSATTIKGYGASAGRVTARACVMLGPEDFDKMQQGDVIVAGITTPAWTPLFARAAGIVTDIGGPLSHSSIVAREYGLPAVLATAVGTRRIRDGQTITVDGTRGEVILVSR